MIKLEKCYHTRLYLLIHFVNSKITKKLRIGSGLLIHFVFVRCTMLDTISRCHCESSKPEVSDTKQPRAVAIHRHCDTNTLPSIVKHTLYLNHYYLCDMGYNVCTTMYTCRGPNVQFSDVFSRKCSECTSQFSSSRKSELTSAKSCTVMYLKR